MTARSILLVLALLCASACERAGQAAAPTPASAQQMEPRTLPPARRRDEYSERFRPQFHFSPLSGWIADPNGMIRYHDQYHLYWWGHAVSDDLVYWRDQIPWAMHGDDGSFIYFSGSVVVDFLNSSGFGAAGAAPILAFYTMHIDDSSPERQGLSISDDFSNFFYYHGSPVLSGQSRVFRDPQVFYDSRRRRWLMIIAHSDRQSLSLYTSGNLVHWRYLSAFGGAGARSRWWEVPDMLELAVEGGGSKWLVICGHSPNAVQYFIGDFDGDRFVLDAAANARLLTGAGLPGQIYADFENGLPEGWRASGGPAASVLVRAGPEAGLGDGRLSTRSSAGERQTAIEITSPEFTVREAFVNFLIAGGDDAAGTGVELLIDGEAVARATGANSELMRWASWDVRAWRGSAASLRIYDNAVEGAFSHIAIDHVMFSPTAMEAGREHANWLDYGLDYYAARVYRDYDGAEDRTVIMGWMGNWNYANLVPTTWGRGALALPRELSLHRYEGGLRVHQRPIPALAKLRKTPARYSTRALPARADLGELMGFAPGANTYELALEFTPGGDSAQFGLELATGADGQYGIRLVYDTETAALVLERPQPETGEFSADFAATRSAPLALVDGRISLRIFVDQSSVEIFANDGELAMTAAMFPEAGSARIGLFSLNAGSSQLAVTAWPLRSIWQDTPGIVQQPR